MAERAGTREASDESMGGMAPTSLFDSRDKMMLGVVQMQQDMAVCMARMDAQVKALANNLSTVIGVVHAGAAQPQPPAAAVAHATAPPIAATASSAAAKLTYARVAAGAAAPSVPLITQQPAAAANARAVTVVLPAGTGASRGTARRVAQSSPRRFVATQRGARAYGVQVGAQGKQRTVSVAEQGVANCGQEVLITLAQMVCVPRIVAANLVNAAAMLATNYEIAAATPVQMAPDDKGKQAKGIGALGDVESKGIPVSAMPAAAALVFGRDAVGRNIAHFGERRLGTPSTLPMAMEARRQLGDMGKSLRRGGGGTPTHVSRFKALAEQQTLPLPEGIALIVFTTEMGGHWAGILNAEPILMLGQGNAATPATCSAWTRSPRGPSHRSYLRSTRRRGRCGWPWRRR